MKYRYVINTIKFIYQCNLRRVRQFKLEKAALKNEESAVILGMNSWQNEMNYVKYIPVTFSKEFDESAKAPLTYDMQIYGEFLSEEEERSLLCEVDPYVKKFTYQSNDCYNILYGFRETECLHWNPKNTEILDRVRKLAFPPGKKLIDPIHIMDLNERGHINAHIDDIHYCGSTIAGLNLLSDGIMRLNYERTENMYADFLLQRRSLYIMKDVARYEYSHGILGPDGSTFQGQKIKRGRRISIIFRCKP